MTFLQQNHQKHQRSILDQIRVGFYHRQDWTVLVCIDFFLLSKHTELVLSKNLIVQKPDLFWLDKSIKHC